MQVFARAIGIAALKLVDGLAEAVAGLLWNLDHEFDVKVPTAVGFAIADAFALQA
jgi:hypothetical protein